MGAPIAPANRLRSIIQLDSVRLATFGALLRIYSKWKVKREKLKGKRAGHNTPDICPLLTFNFRLLTISYR
jgi:hypothetical protein